MNIDEMKLGDIKVIANMFNASEEKGLNYHLGKKVIIRTFSAGAWFGKLVEKSGSEVILEDARRLFYWRCKKSISLSGVAVYGLESDSKVCPAIKRQWLEAIEIIEMTKKAIDSIEEIKDVEAR